MIAINIFAVLVAAVIQFFIGYLWYSKALFGNIFMKALGKTEAELEMKITDILGPFAISFLSFLLFAILLDLFAVLDILSSILTALIIWGGFIVTTNLYAVFFEYRDLRLYLINVGYNLVGLLIGAVIISVWP